MKTSLWKVVATAAFATIAATSAFAADMPVKARPAAVDVWTWDKWYIGLNGGYSWGRSDTTGTFYNNTTGAQLNPTQNTTLNLDGGVFGGQIGKNWQNGKWVFGIEADGQWSGEKGSALFTCSVVLGACNPNTAVAATSGLSPTTTFNQEIAWFATFRGRAGGLITPTALLYVTGGAVVAGIKTNGVLTGVTGAGAVTSVAWGNDSTNWGWVATGPARSRPSIWTSAASPARPSCSPAIRRCASTTGLTLRMSWFGRA